MPSPYSTAFSTTLAKTKRRHTCCYSCICCKTQPQQLYLLYKYIELLTSVLHVIKQSVWRLEVRVYRQIAKTRQSKTEIAVSDTMGKGRRRHLSPVTSARTGSRQLVVKCQMIVFTFICLQSEVAILIRLC